MDTNSKLILKIAALITVIIAVISIFGMVLYNSSPQILQGEIECTRIKISGKLLGRIDEFYVQEGSCVNEGDTLVLINSPEADALFQSASAMEDAAGYQNMKVDAGARSQIIESLKEAWIAAGAQASLANSTYQRIERLYKDSVVSLQRKEEAEALAKAANAAESAAKLQYEMAQEGAQQEDKGTARALVDAARGNVDEVKALLLDSRLTAPSSGIISEIYPSRGELVMPGATIMEILETGSSHVVLNVREDMLHMFAAGKVFKGKIPALNNASIDFKVYYTSPLGSYATWQSARQSNSYNLVTFKIKAKPVEDNAQTAMLRPGMSVIVQYKGEQ